MGKGLCVAIVLRMFVNSSAGENAGNGLMLTLAPVNLLIAIHNRIFALEECTVSSVAQPNLIF